MLIEMAVADAYGIGSEFVPATPDRPNDLSRFHQHPRYGDLRPGMYTDDTLRALANARVLLHGDPLDAASYAESYVRTFRADRRMGWSKRFQSLLQGIVDEEADDARAGRLLLLRADRRAESNGALMGVAPLGFLREPRMVSLAAAVQAMTTHGLETVPYAQAVALVAHHAIHGGDGDVDDFVADNLGTHSVPSWRGDPLVPTDVSARGTYKAVRRAIAANDTLSGIMTWSVERGGDTDSVAACAVALASHDRRVASDVPHHLLDALETPEGRDELAAVDDALWRRFVDPRARAGNG